MMTRRSMRKRGAGAASVRAHALSTAGPCCLWAKMQAAQQVRVFRGFRVVGFLGFWGFLKSPLKAQQRCAAGVRGTWRPLD